jgi:hypothetical protein
MYSSGQWLLSVTDAPTSTASRRPFHVKQSQPSLAGRCPVSEVLSQRPEDRLDAWQSISEPGVLEVRGRATTQPSLCGFPGGNPAAAAERFHGVRIRGTSQRNENFDVGARQA